MPEMNGIDLVHAIRRRDQTLPVIIVTGFADLELMREIESCDARLFEKPINFHALRAYIESLHICRERSNVSARQSCVRSGI